MQLLVRDKGFYKKLGLIAFPIAMQNLITFGVSMADTVMIGLLGQVHLSAAALANQVGFVFMLFTFGLAGGSNVLISQFWGKGDVTSIHKVLTIMYRFLLAGGFLFTAIAIFVPTFAMSIFTTEPEVISLGAKFLRIVGFSYLLAGFNNVTVIMLRSVGSVRVSLVMSITGLCTNVFLNWVLIFGKFGFPALGMEGAAIATCLARLAEFLVVLVYLTKFESKIRYHFRSFFIRHTGILHEYMSTAFPVIINEILWGLGTATISVIIGRMGTAFTAANSICSVLSQLVTIFIFGVGNASAVIIGNTIGKGEYETAKGYATTLLVLSILLGAVSSIIVLLLRDPIISIYDFEEITNLYASQIITVYAGIVLFQSFSAIALLGIIRGGGDTRFSLLMDLLFMWLLCIPLGFVGSNLAWAVPMVYFVIKCDEIFKTALSIYRVRSGKWINDVTR